MTSGPELATRNTDHSAEKNCELESCTFPPPLEYAFCTSLVIAADSLFIYKLSQQSRQFRRLCDLSC